MTVLQRIAPRHSAELPQDDVFFPVKCYDVSAGGASFLLAGPPSFDRLVFAFDIAEESTTYIAADVVNVTDVRISRSGSLTRLEDEASPTKPVSSLANRGRHMFLVGCRFTERLGTKPSSRSRAT